LQLPGAWLWVPMLRAGQLQGGVLLLPPRTPLEVNWEVRDALATAAAQAATALRHWQAFDALLASQRFDAAHRLTTFCLHDLKNCVAQLSLLNDNARRHASRPEFQQDMLHTLGHVVARMSALIHTLKGGGAREAPHEVDLPALLRTLVDEMALQHPAPMLHVESSAPVSADVTRLYRVIGHLVQNAIDATDAAGRVWINLRREDAHVLIEIHDTGQGMSDDFMREKLFKPFHTTKANGMGIGAYEAAQTIRDLGGRLEAVSAPGQGTTITVRLPAHAGAAEQRVAA